MWRELEPGLRIEVRETYARKPVDEGSVLELKGPCFNSLPQILIRGETRDWKLVYHDQLRRWRIFDPMFNESTEERRRLYELRPKPGQPYPSEIRKRQYPLW